MELRWEPRVEDWSEAFEAKARAMKPKYQVRMSPYAFLRGLTIFLALLAVVYGVTGVLAGNVLMLVFPALLFLLIWWLWRRNPDARPGRSTPDVIALKLFQQEVVRRPQRLLLDETGISSLAEETTHWAWPDVVRVLETERMFVAVVRPEYATLQAKKAVKVQARISRALAVVPLPKRAIDDVAGARQLLGRGESGVVTAVEVPEPQML